MCRFRDVFALAWQRRTRSALALLTLLGLCSAGLVTSSGVASASVGSDKDQIAKLERQIAEQGSRVQSIVTRYNQVQARVTAIDAQIADDASIIAGDHRAQDTATVAARRVAVAAYVTGGGFESTPLATFDNVSNASALLEHDNYLGSIRNKFNNALVALQTAQAHTSDDERALRAVQAQVKSSLRQLAAAHDAAESAIASEEAMLGHVKSNLRATVVADQQRRAEQLAAERTLAPPTTSSPSPSLDAPTGPTLPTQLPVAPPIVTVPAPRPSSPGSYANPLRAVGALSPERIDQGVDYSGFGPIYAIGDGVVLSTGGDWPGGTFIAYRLTDGPAQGLVVYAAEDIVPNVQVGAKVTANTVLGQVYAGPTGIESGWADGSALGNTMARTYGQYNGSNSTAFGANFSRLLRALGAPPGTLQGQPTGVLPAGWPTW